jgi:hypothetical protein
MLLKEIIAVYTDTHKYEYKMQSYWLLNLVVDFPL